ncbi:hypothetical protein [Halobacillus sp. BAB-2008]|uniref:hypothetical protein n=1 Tax=Halobacillus sp. BAB-2008 TaxID=1246484 RepID=UPI0002A4E95A|nr:hypothetical protein [Halobacillus sp. BAB-2008]ELK46726.1 hypothetical protein D479_09581 [Halobacillus sp. BAB-2008]
MLTLNVPEVITCQAVITGTLTCAETTPVEGAEVFFSDFPEDTVTYDPNPAVTDVNGDFTTTVTVPVGTPLVSITIEASAIVFGEVQMGFAGTQIECPPVECPCKFRIGLRDEAKAQADITDRGKSFSVSGEINVSAIQCFQTEPGCNPDVDDFNISFEGKKVELRFFQGRRIDFSCDGDRSIRLRGTAIAKGYFRGVFDVSIEVTIDDNNIGTWIINADNGMGQSFSTVFRGRMSKSTSIGDCGLQF